jgi:hypothetical protein
MGGTLRFCCFSAGILGILGIVEVPLSRVALQNFNVSKGCAIQNILAFVKPSTMGSRSLFTGNSDQLSPVSLSELRYWVSPL